MFAKVFRNKSESTYSVGEKVFKGRVNQHRTLIQKEPKEIYNVLINPDLLNRWCPVEQISVERITPGEFGVGTRQHYRLRFRIQPEWDSEVIHLEKPHQIVNRFLDGIFEGGIEIWDLKKIESGTEVTHTLVYPIKRWIYKIGWFFLSGEKKHNELTELALCHLKSLVEGTTP